MDETFKSISNHKKVYLASDFHLGIPTPTKSLEREKKIIRWLDSVADDAEAILLVGDIFDFWFEFQHVIPKGYIRFLGKIAELSDRGITVIFFTGNHDLWMADYFTSELGVRIIRKPTSFRIGSNSILIGHGDGLGPGDTRFKVIKKVFKNKLARWGFQWLHPDLGLSLAHRWSAKSRQKDEDKFLGEKEVLLLYCREIEATMHHDYYIFGHRHLTLEMQVNEQATYINLGAWFDDPCAYVEIDSQKATLKNFEG